MDISIFLFCLMIGAFAGIISGLFGGGIGLILIPAVIWVLHDLHVRTIHSMQIAIATSVAAIVIMGFMSAYKHHKRQAVNWDIVRKMTVSMFLGIVAGALLAGKLPSQILILLFGVIVFFLAIYLYFGKDELQQHVDASTVLLRIAAGFIGFMGSFLGINAFAVPFFKKLGMDLRIAVGTTAVLGALLAVGIMIMYIITGFGLSDLPKYSTGFVDWTLFLPLAIGGTVFSPIGVMLAHRIPRQKLKLLYSLLLIIISIKMLFTAAYGF